MLCMQTAHRQGKNSSIHKFRSVENVWECSGCKPVMMKLYDCVFRRIEGRAEDLSTFTDFLSRTGPISEPHTEFSSSAMFDLYSLSSSRLLCWLALSRIPFFVSKLLSRKSPSVSEDPPRWLLFRLPTLTASEPNSSSLRTSSTDPSGS